MENKKYSPKENLDRLHNGEITYLEYCRLPREDRMAPDPGDES